MLIGKFHEELSEFTITCWFTEVASTKRVWILAADNSHFNFGVGDNKSIKKNLQVLLGKNAIRKCFG